MFLSFICVLDTWEFQEEAALDLHPLVGGSMVANSILTSQGYNCDFFLRSSSNIFSEMWQNHANDFYFLEDALYDIAFHGGVPQIHEL